MPRPTIVEMLTPLFIALIVGYLLGSLPFGYLVARAKGVNIFEVGSKNPGATNVRRVLGSGPGNLVFFLDALKGAVASSWALLRFGVIGAELEVRFLRFEFAVREEEWIAIGVAGLAGALLGHSFSCFTKFRGGKGVATATGGLAVIIPASIAIAAAVWVATFYGTRYVSVASMFAALTLPISVFAIHGRSVLVWVAFAIAVFVIVRHRANIQRLMNGTETKFVKKPKIQSS